MSKVIMVIALNIRTGASVHRQWIESVGQLGLLSTHIMTVRQSKA